MNFHPASEYHGWLSPKTLEEKERFQTAKRSAGNPKNCSWSPRTGELKIIEKPGKAGSRERFESIIRKHKATTIPKPEPRTRWNKISARFRVSDLERELGRYRESRKTEQVAETQGRDAWIGYALHQAMKGPRGIRK